MKSFVAGGLRDLSISRTTFDWGVPVPDDPDHVMYVWLDALTNYLSAVGYPDTQGDDYKTFWPGDHMVGKDILRFHAVYWPAFLMAAGIEPPNLVYAHGWWTNEGQKISKSLGNVIDPYEIVETYGLDQVRYFLLREVPFGNDGDFSQRAMVGRTNADLANDFGNLAQRVLSMIAKNCDGKLPEPGDFTEADERLLEACGTLLTHMRVDFHDHRFHVALTRHADLVTAANRYVDDQAPWALRKTDPARMATVLYVLAETIRTLAMLAHPVMPDACDRMLEQLAVGPGLVELRRPGRRGPHDAGHGTAQAGSGVRQVRRNGGGRGRGVMLVDSHCHLDYLAGDGDLDAVIGAPPGLRASVICRPSVPGSTSSMPSRQLPPPTTTSAARSGSIPTTSPTTGCPRPWSAWPRWPKRPTSSASARPASISITSTARGDAQAASFRTHIRAARETGLPLIVHTRDADAATIGILREEAEQGAYPGLIHCFSASAELAQAALDLGLFISLSGIVTLKNAGAVRAVARAVPPERLLIETDAPYLAPVPTRGRRNEPAFVAHTAAFLAELLDSDTTTLAARTSENFFRFFAKARRPDA